MSTTIAQKAKGNQAPSDSFSKQDLGFEPANLSGAQLIEYLDSQINATIEKVQETPFWKALSSPNTNPELLRMVMQEINLEIVMYQPDVIESTIGIIGQFPRYIPANLIEEMLHHQAEEFDHGEMALKDYVNLGGEESFARNRRMSPSAFGVAAMWEFLKHKRDPFAYLGAVFPFEGMTPIITEMAKKHLRAKGIKASEMVFVEYHSTADLEHTDLVKELICNIADTYPESREPICYGLSYFLSVYPLPSWNAAYDRALKKYRSMLCND